MFLTPQLRITPDKQKFIYFPRNAIYSNKKWKGSDVTWANQKMWNIFYQFPATMIFYKIMFSNEGTAVMLATCVVVPLVAWVRGSGLGLSWGMHVFLFLASYWYTDFISGMAHASLDGWEILHHPQIGKCQKRNEQYQSFPLLTSQP